MKDLNIREAWVPKFWSKIDSSGGEHACWPWIGVLNTKGYGMFSDGAGRSGLFAHRVSYHLSFGPIPNGLECCHTCDNRRCVNPSHLFLGTHKENMEDMRRKRRYARAEDKARGERHGQARLTEEDVKSILQSAMTIESRTSIAKRFGVCHSTINDIVHGKTWLHVERPCTYEKRKPGLIASPFGRAAMREKRRMEKQCKQASIQS